MLFDELVSASAAVTETRARLAKTGAIADVLTRLAPEEVPVAVPYLSGELPQGSIGIGWATLRNTPEAAPDPGLSIMDVHAILGRIAVTTGKGSQAARRELIHELFSKATEDEQRFLIRLLLGDLRQGALEGVMIEAIAKSSGAPPGEVRRAHMLAGDLAEVATAALVEGPAGLSRFQLEVLRPLQPMLAQSADGIDDALDRISPAALEWKLDGARLQVHRLGNEVRAFTRNLADVTNRVPELVDEVLALPVAALVMDGETIALRKGGRPHPFQVTMSRFGSKLDVERARAITPLSLFAFDLLHLDGEDTIDRPQRERFEALKERLPESLVVPHTVASGRAEATAFFEDALGRGHEGVMAKDLDAPYEAGRRGAGWLKVKRALTLDLVVLAAEWGHGRRRGWLSNLHLGARDPNGGLVMLGKTFKGMTDEMLTWQTEKLLSLETGREGITVHVKPELVVEIAFDGLQGSSRYPGGVALRFARIKGYRHDKTPADADTIDTVRALYDGSGSS